MLGAFARPEAMGMKSLNARIRERDIDARLSEMRVALHHACKRRAFTSDGLWVTDIRPMKHLSPEERAHDVDLAHHEI